MDNQRRTGIRIPRILALELLLGVFLLSACATPATDGVADKEYDKENELLLAKEDYEHRRQQCEKMRGVMTIPRYSTNSRQEHTASEYKMAQCRR
jgi:aminoglycoside/choline kinase family phosphotransferase